MPIELLGFYKAQHSIYGECPICGEPFRLSEIKMWHGDPSQRLATQAKEA